MTAQPLPRAPDAIACARSPLTEESARARREGRAAPPTAREVAHLRATDGKGARLVALAVATTALGIFASTRAATLAWLGGQLVLSIAMVQWFCLMHEAGHRTLFRARAPHALVGHIGALFSGIPYPSWKIVHRMHHKWTGWQDVDPTTASLAPRKRNPLDVLAGRVAWKIWFPYFALHYRVAFIKFWRVRNAAPDAAGKRAITLGTLGLLAAYAVVAASMGPALFARVFALAALLSFVWIEPVMLSQHTHIPMKLARDLPTGESPQPIGSPDQEPYTRSIRVPRWIAAGVLFDFDAHELHHIYPWLPGYALRKVPYATMNEMDFFTWVWRVRRMSATDFLLKNRLETGEDV